MNNITIGKEKAWDFDFRYHLELMDVDELEVLMTKYEIELKRTLPVYVPIYSGITEILGRLYKEIMKRRRVILIE